MKFLVDANVLSEATKPSPDPRIVAWLQTHEADLAVDPIILGEIRYGILLLKRGARRTKLERWFDAGIGGLHCLPWDAATGLRWAALLAELRARGRSMPIKDSMIAATAFMHDLAISTLNKKDFAPSGVKLVDPFA